MFKRAVSNIYFFLQFIVISSGIITEMPKNKPRFRTFRSVFARNLSLLTKVPHVLRGFRPEPTSSPNRPQ